MTMSPYALGATLYMPALHPDICDIVSGRKLAGLTSLVICLEDALREDDVEAGLGNLRTVLDILAQESRGAGTSPLVFVRPRHLEMAKVMASWRGIDRVDGFVAPKVRPGNVGAWGKAIEGTNLLLMPTLETSEMFDAFAVRDLRDELLSIQDRILALRIGGNDLMSALGLRRATTTTLYQGPLLHVVSMLIGTLSPAGFALTSPVCEIIDNEALLRAELEQDVAFGLVGKTAIHPRQVPIILEAFKVVPQDLESAQQILAQDAAAVFKLNGAMCEPSTHRAWAHRILARAEHFGVAAFPLRPVAAA